MRGIHKAALPLLVTTIVGLGGCGQQAGSPETADGAVHAVFQGLADHDPSVVWEAMPESWQKDVEGLVHEFAAKLDPESYDAAFRVARKFVGILRDKKQFLLGYPMVTMFMPDRERVEQNWSTVVDMLSTLVDSELKSLASLRELDVGSFLSGTGRRFFSKLAAVTEMTRENPFDKLRETSVDLVHGSGDQARIRVTFGGSSREVDMTKVEGRWVPSPVARQWEVSMNRARKGLASMSKQSASPESKAAVQRAEELIDQLMATETQQEFNQLLTRLMQGPQRRPAGKPGR